ncbi:hypothetical protein [Halosegnis marinus]|uniref:DUF5658 domain-containing protein n=1 Tax=Halosegnis marinus TaxID=3034023 RepID=A0ABD5ZPZ6_9EURY|nr:hypothetical protein [Halosegnis sp. DT85]
MAARLDATVRRLADRQRRLWLLALASYGLGDLATTLVGLAAGRGAEAGPLAAGLLGRYGLAGIVLLKLGSLAVFALLWRVAPNPGRVAIPLALSVVGVGVTAWNVFVLL